MQVPKSDFDLVSYIRIILGSIHEEVLYFCSGFTVVVFDIRGARRKFSPASRCCPAILNSYGWCLRHKKKKQTGKSGKPRISDLAHSRTEAISSI